MKFADKLVQVCRRILGLEKQRPSPRLRRHKRLGVEPLGERILLAGDLDVSFLAPDATTV